MCIILQRSFGTDGEKNFCKVYKPDKNGMIKERNFEVGDIMMLKEQNCWRNQWPLTRIIGVDANRNGDVHSVTLCVADSHNGNQTLRRPITKIVLLVENEIDSPLKGAIRISQDEISTSWEEPDINDT